MAGDLGLDPFEPDLEVGDRRRRAARGALVNAAFLIGLNALGFLKGFAVAAFLSTTDYGTWGLLIVAFTTVLQLAQVGVDDKYVQQRERDQRAAFQTAFTLQLLLCGLFVVLVALALPLYALVYDQTSILAPGYVLLAALLALPFQTPLWTYYRRMDYLTQRRLQAYDPIVGFVVTIVLAIAGAGYWALVAGVVAGAWAAGIAAVRASPYPLALRLDRAAAREYWTFSGPLFLGGLAAALIAFVPVVVAKHAVGLAAVGAIALAATISNYASRVDDIVTNTLYPAICAVADRRDLLLESFLKSNRLALLWAMPLGAGVALFAGALVDHGLGQKWHGAIYVVQALAVAAALNQVGFNWSAFFRAIGRTGPLAWGAWAMVAGVVGFCVPLVISDGVDGYGTGMVAAVILVVLVRLAFLRSLFPLGAILANVLRGAAPTLPALGAVLAVRAAGGAATLAQLALFAVIVVMATYASERALLRELRGYLRRDGAQPAAA